MQLTINHISKEIKGKAIIKDISFNLEHGDVLGIIGPNGAGKTTIMKIICGLCQMTSGSVLLDDQPISYYYGKKEYPIGVMIESPSMYKHLSGYKNVEINALTKGIRNKEICNNAIINAGLLSSKDLRVGKYSLGMKQRLGIAMSIINDPKIVVLDEPINGLDPDGIKYVRELIKSLSNKNKIVIVSSHILSELNLVCNKVCFIKSGRMVSIINTYMESEDLETIYGQLISGGNT
ncbi:ABC transporter ATP-binding protein [Lachnotalea glycerini]|nr:ATP-binding cassette domain-containing protein [Lachnotalea glycerini]